MAAGGGPGGLGYDDATQRALLFGGVPMGQQQQPHPVYIRDDAFGISASGLSDGAHGGGKALSSSAEVYKPTAAVQPSGAASGDLDGDGDDSNGGASDKGDTDAAAVRGDGKRDDDRDGDDSTREDAASSTADGAVASTEPSRLAIRRRTVALVPGKWNKTRVVHTQGSILWLHEDEQSASLADMEVRRSRVVDSPLCSRVASVYSPALNNNVISRYVVVLAYHCSHHVRNVTKTKHLAALCTCVLTSFLCVLYPR